MKEQDIYLMAYLEKYYWFWKAKADLFKIAIDIFGKRNRLLDVGCGAGNLLRMGKSLGYNCVGLDKSETVNKVITDLPVVIGDIENFSTVDKFDTILISDVLEHCDDKKAIENIKNSLNDGGVVIATVPMFKFLWGQDDIRLQHQRRYTKKMLKDLFKDFKILKMSYIQFLLFFPTLLVRNIERLKKTKGSGESFFKKRLLIEECSSDIGKIAMLISLPFKAFFFLINFLIKVEQYIENRFIMPFGLPIGVGMIVIVRLDKK